jgi:AraC-like DNA-binding protein
MISSSTSSVSEAARALPVSYSNRAAFRPVLDMTSTSGRSFAELGPAGTVGVSLVRAIVHEIDRTGGGAREILAEARIEETLLDQPYARLDTETYAELQRLALERTGNPALGLTMGRHASLASFGLVGHMATHCRTLRDAFHLWMRYYELAASVQPPRLVEEGDRGHLVYEFLRSSDPRCQRLRAEFGMTCLLVAVRALAGAELYPDEVWFEHEEPPYAEEYRRIFGDHVAFERPHTGFTFPRALLDTRLVHHDENVLRILQEQADRVLAELRDQGGVAGKVRRALVSGFPDDGFTVEAVARRVGMSARGLRRKLQQDGHTFQEILREAMGELSCRLLADPKTTIHEVAYRLGFSEPSAFHRAFKRWTGMTPREWRRAREVLPTEGR